MRLPKTVILGGGAILLLALAATRPVAADVGPALQIQDINITGDEFVRLKNVGGAPAEMEDYWLGYASDPADIATPEQQLPVGQLTPDQSLLLSRESMATCGAAYSGKLDFSFSNSGGAVSLWQLDNNKFSQIWRLAWDDQTSGGNQVTTSRYYLDMNDDNPFGGAPVGSLQPVWHFGVVDGQIQPSWYVGYQNDCQFMGVKSPQAGAGNQPSVYSWTQAGSGPPFVQAQAVLLDTGNQATGIPAADRGLKAPQLSEILPNPASPKLDSDDEFIELYNPNDTSFDLSDFIIQTASGSGSNHKYHIPVGTNLKPHGFLAFSSGGTSISLSNSGGQAWLLDPLGHVMSHSQPWGKADNGMAWINAGGSWRWTSRPTPGGLNKVAGVLGGSTGGQPAIGDKTVAKIVEDSKSKSSDQPVSEPAATKVNSSLSIHPLTLAIVALAALLYGCYEYRHDIANRYRVWQAQRTAGR